VFTAELHTEIHELNYFLNSIRRFVIISTRYNKYNKT